MRFFLQFSTVITLLFINHLSFAQGIFTSPAQISPYAQQDPPNSTRQTNAPSFPITHLEKTGSLASFSKPTSLSATVSPVKDSVQFVRYVDSLAVARVSLLGSQGLASQRVITNRDRLLNRLRDVPSILPFYVATNKATGLIKTRMSSGFGMRQHPVLGHLISHSGIDLPAPMGTYVYATADGYCRQIISQPEGIGLAIYLTHGRGHQTLYGHLLSTRIKPGDFVHRGQVIGQVGSSGMTTGPHLHYGVRYNGQIVDPLPYCFLLTRPTRPTVAVVRK